MPRSAASRASAASFATPRAITSTNSRPARVASASSPPSSRASERTVVEVGAREHGPAASSSGRAMRARHRAGTSPPAAATAIRRATPRTRARSRSAARAPIRTLIPGTRSRSPSTIRCATSGGEGVVADDRAGVEVVHRRPVRADGDPADFRVGGDRAHRAGRARGDGTRSTPRPSRRRARRASGRKRSDRSGAACLEVDRGEAGGHGAESVCATSRIAPRHPTKGGTCLLERHVDDLGAA